MKVTTEAKWNSWRHSVKTKEIHRHVLRAPIQAKEFYFWFQSREIINNRQLNVKDNWNFSFLLQHSACWYFVIPPIISLIFFVCLPRSFFIPSIISCSTHIERERRKIVEGLTAEKCYLFLICAASEIFFKKMLKVNFCLVIFVPSFVLSVAIRDSYLKALESTKRISRKLERKSHVKEILLLWK